MNITCKIRQVEDYFSIKCEDNNFVIIDNLNNERYSISKNLIFEGKITPFYVEKISSVISELEVQIANTSNILQKMIIREDLKDLSNANDEFLLWDCKEKSFILKSNTAKFNKACEEIIQSFHDYEENRRLAKFINMVMK